MVATTVAGTGTGVGVPNQLLLSTLLLRQQPRLVAALKQRLCLNVNQTIANLIMGLDAGWLVVIMSSVSMTKKMPAEKPTGRRIERHAWSAVRGGKR